MSKRTWWAAIRLIAVVVGVAVAVILLRQSPLGRHLSSVENLRVWVASLAPYDKPAFILAYAVAALFLPGTLLSFVGAIIYGVWLGTVLVWCGAALGSLLPFAVARTLGRPAVETLLGAEGPSLRRLDNWVARRGFTGLLLVRFLPIFPYWLVNYGCGLIGVRFRDYVAATALGILPGTFVYQYLFANVGESVLKEGWHWSMLADPNVTAPLGVFAAFILAGRWWAKRAGAANQKQISAADNGPIKPDGESQVEV